MEQGRWNRSGGTMGSGVVSGRWRDEKTGRDGQVDKQVEEKVEKVGRSGVK